MSSENISIDPDQAATSVNLVVEGHDQVADIAGIVQSHGTGAGPAVNFKAVLDTYVVDMQEAIGIMQDQLLRVREGITATVQDLGEKDATLANETETFLAGVESVPTPPESTPVATGAKPSTSASKVL